MPVDKPINEMTDDELDAAIEELQTARFPTEQAPRRKPTRSDEAAAPKGRKRASWKDALGLD